MIEAINSDDTVLRKNLVQCTQTKPYTICSQSEVSFTSHPTEQRTSSTPREARKWQPDTRMRKVVRGRRSQQKTSNALTEVVLELTSRFDEISVVRITPREMSTAVPWVFGKLPDMFGKHLHMKDNREWRSKRDEVNRALFRLLKKSDKDWPHWAVNYFRRLKDAVGA